MNDDLHHLPLSGGVVPVRWRRNPRARRISVRIDARQAGVIVTLPPRGTQEAGLALLRAHASWVTDRLHALPPETIWADGESVSLGGVPHRLRHRPDERRGAWIEAGEIHVSGEAAFLPRRVLDLLQAEAKTRLGALAREKAALAALHPARITIKDTSSRWGSCTAGGVLMFSWRLVMAPVFVQDYVAAHEVAHLRHMDHSPTFWRLVQTLTPHTKPATRWLCAHGAALMRAGP